MHFNNYFPSTKRSIKSGLLPLVFNFFDLQSTLKPKYDNYTHLAEDNKFRRRHCIKKNLIFLLQNPAYRIVW